MTEARSGSTHGYDVVDPPRISEALGGEEAFRGLYLNRPFRDWDDLLPEYPFVLAEKGGILSG